MSSENVSVYTLGKGKAGNKQRNPVFITGIHAMEIRFPYFREWLSM